MTEELNDQKIEGNDSEAQHVSFEAVQATDDIDEKRKPQKMKSDQMVVRSTARESNQ